MQLRLDKYLADAGLGTRSEVKKQIRSGAVRIDGVPAKSAETKVDPEKQTVTMNGKPVTYTEYAYYILNKPAGIVSASRDKNARTVIDLIPRPRKRDLFPVGRLDKDTVGLLLITNDGKMAQNLLSPGKHVEKRYYIQYEGTLPQDAVERVSKGLDIGDDTPTAPAKLILPDGTAGDGSGTPRTVPGRSTVPNWNGEAELILTEGRYHQVKRMFEALGCKVVFLERKAMGNLTLPEDMERGEVREITREEIEGI